MNDMRERLIELLTDNLPRIGEWPKCDNPLQYKDDEIVERLAYHLLANGVIIPPCKVGDTVYRLVACPLRVSRFTWEIVEIKIFADEIHFVDDSDNVFVADEIGKTVFLTREEAERALKERGQGGC